MQGNEKEQLLSEVLDACMEEQLSFIPPEREIARMHTFSREFQEYMTGLLKTREKPEHRKLAKQEFVYRFNRVAAGLLILLVAGGLCTGTLLLFAPKGVMKDTPAEAPQNATDMAGGNAMTTAEVTMEEEAAEGAPEEAVLEEPEMEIIQDFPKEAEFMGSQIRLAASQNLPEETEYIKTLVNSPMAARDAHSIKVTVGNLNDYPIYYYKVMDLEVWIDGAWYLVPSKQVLAEEDQNTMVMLEPEMAQDEELLLEYYKLDYEAEKYRVVTYLDGLILSSEFRFENLNEDLEEVLESKQ